jgi:hypothetical protein
MYIDFAQLPDNARVWVYLSEKAVSTDQQNQIGSFLRTAMKTWAAHGEPLTGGFEFSGNHFLILGVDQAAHLPSGCSIDASMRWIKEINQTFGLDFLFRSIAIQNDSDISFAPIFGIKKSVSTGIIRADSLIYDQQIQILSEYKTAFLKPAYKVFENIFEQV